MMACGAEWRQGGRARHIATDGAGGGIVVLNGKSGAENRCEKRMPMYEEYGPELYRKLFV